MASATKSSTVVGVFENHHDADRAVAELRGAGFSNSQIGVVGHDKNGGTTTDKGTKVEEGAIVGAAVGAGAGGLIGLGILAGLIPAIGPVIAGGALAALLANAAGGAAIAGLVGTLVGLGVPEDDAKYYDTVPVRTHGRHGPRRRPAGRRHRHPPPPQRLRPQHRRQPGDGGRVTLLSARENRVRGARFSRLVTARGRSVFLPILSGSGGTRTRTLFSTGF